MKETNGHGVLVSYLSVMGLQLEKDIGFKSVILQWEKLSGVYLLQILSNLFLETIVF